MNESTIARPTSMGGPEQADAWLARLLSPECTREERAEFELWLARSPRHVDAYLEAETMHRLVAELGDDPLLRAAARRARRETGARTAGRRWGWIASGLAAALALVAGGALWLGRAPQPPAAEAFATVVGQQRSLVLADGTRVHLDTDSAIVARFGEDAREIEVERGRVQFTVAADPHRPFRVRAGAGTVEDIGTTFQVRREGADVSVGLIEGAVIVSGREGASARLAPGEQIAVDARGRVGTREAFDLEVASGWTRGELVFKRRRLDQLVAEMNRYSSTRLRLADAELGALTVSGVFHAGDQASLVAALRQGWGLQAERTGDGEIVLRKAR